MTPDTIFYIAIGLTAAAAGWGVAQLIMAAAHTDRRHLQERMNTELERGLTPSAGALLLRRQSEGLPGALAGSPMLQRLAKRLGHVFPNTSVRRFLLLTLVLAAAASIGAGMLMQSVAWALLSGAIAGAVPPLVLNARWARRQRVLSDQLTDALDFLARALRAGHGLSTGFQMMGDELPEPIATQFRRCYQQHALGTPLEEAMTQMAGRIDSTDFAFFVTAVLIQRQTGGDLSEVLDNISTMVRNRIRLQQHTQALTAEGRLSGYILLALPPALFVFMLFRKPDYAGLLLFTSLGRMMLISVIGLQVVGMIAMRKIVRVKV